jgi:hypothetical protein
LPKKTPMLVKFNIGIKKDKKEKEKKRGIRLLIYNFRAEDLFRFIDTYKEFVALVFDSSKAVR